MENKSEIEELFTPRFNDDGDALGVFLIMNLKRRAAKAGISEDQVTEDFRSEFYKFLISVSRMAIPLELQHKPIVVNALKDYGLGVYLLGASIIAAADIADFSSEQLTEECIQWSRTQILKLETDSARHAATEKALHKAAEGHFELAGKVLRELLWIGANDIYQKNHAVIGLARRMQQSNFAKAGIKTKKESSEEIKKKVLEAAREICGSRKTQPSGRKLADLIFKKTGIAFGTVRSHISNLRKEKLLS